MIKSSTNVGEQLFNKPLWPIPNSPFKFDPIEYILPLFVIKAEWETPQEICVIEILNVQNLGIEYNFPDFFDDNPIWPNLLA